MDAVTTSGVIAELVSLLTEGNAHVPFAEACAGLTSAQWNQHVPQVPYTIWQVVEHVRIAQWDIVEFSLGAAHKSPDWPTGYWPNPSSTADEATWHQTLDHITADQQRFIQLLQQPGTNLLAPIPHGSGQTLLREAMLIADHTAYHTGEIVLLRRILQAWK